MLCYVMAMITRWWSRYNCKWIHPGRFAWNLNSPNWKSGKSFFNLNLHDLVFFLPLKTFQGVTDLQPSWSSIRSKVWKLPPSTQGRSNGIHRGGLVEGDFNGESRGKKIRIQYCKSMVNWVEQDTSSQNSHSSLEKDHVHIGISGKAAIWS